MEVKQNSRKKYYIIFLAILLMVMSIIPSFAEGVKISCNTSYVIDEEYGAQAISKTFENYGDYIVIQYKDFYGTLRTRTCYIVSINNTSFVSYTDNDGNIVNAICVYVMETDNFHLLRNIGDISVIKSGDIVDLGFVAVIANYIGTLLSVPNLETGNPVTCILDADIKEQLNIVTGQNNYVTSPMQICTVSDVLGKEVPVYMSVITEILAVFSAMGQWFVSIVPTVLAVFWTPGTEGTDGQLTIIGALAVASLAIAVILLILNWVVNFFKFRGQ